MAVEVQMLSQKLIKPSTATPTHDHNITFFDQLAPQAFVRLVFFYSPSESDPNVNNLLQKSLSDTLTCYPPFAGRFKEDGLAITCQGQGVPYLEARVLQDLLLDEFLSKAYNDPTLLNAFIPQDLGEVKSVTTPMVYIQATSFKCGGLALGIVRSHALADGYSTTSFLHHWATVNKGLHKEAIIRLPDFHLAQLFPPNMLPMKPQPSILKIGHKKTVYKTLVFSGEAISSLKAIIISSCDGAGSSRISRVAIVAATIWRALICISRAKNGYLRPSVLYLTFSLRGRNDLISKTSFGNVYTRVPVRFSADHKNNMVELDHLVSLVGDAIKSVVVAISKASTCHEIASLALNLQNEVREEMMNENVDVFPLTSWCKFDPSILDVDFGWGKPCWVGTLLRSEITVLMDTKCGMGIEARVNLNEVDMIEFEHDPNIKPFISPSCHLNGSDETVSDQAV